MVGTKKCQCTTAPWLQLALVCLEAQRAEHQCLSVSPEMKHIVLSVLSPHFKFLGSNLASSVDIHIKVLSNFVRK